jgi:hypothetical protein
MVTRSCVLGSRPVRVVLVAWQIAGQVGPHTEPDYDGSGWLWELTRDGDARRVFVLVSGSALASAHVPCDDTAEAIRTEGRSEVERVAALDDPPRIVRCLTTIVEDVYAE